MTRQDIFIFDNLNSEGYFERQRQRQPTSEYFNRKITITENEEYKTDNKQYKYFVKLGGGKIGGIDKDGNGLTFCSQPRKLTLIKENNKKEPFEALFWCGTFMVSHMFYGLF